MKNTLGAFQDLVNRAEARRTQLIAHAARLKADLPLKFLRQQAHFTTPDLAKAEAAQVGG